MEPWRWNSTQMKIVESKVNEVASPSTQLQIMFRIMVLISWIHPFNTTHCLSRYRSGLNAIVTSLKSLSIIDGT